LIDAETAERIQAIRRHVYDSEDYAEGIRSFKEKRPPVFTGKLFLLTGILHFNYSSIVQMIKSKLHYLQGCACVLLLASCGTVRTDNEVRVKTESEIKPIHITIDVNVRVQRELENFFGDIDKASQTIKP